MAQIENEMGTVSFQYKWEYTKQELRQITRFDDHMPSPTFVTSHKDLSYRWSVGFFPNGSHFNGYEVRQHVSFYLHLMEADNYDLKIDVRSVGFGIRCLYGRKRSLREKENFSISEYDVAVEDSMTKGSPRFLTKDVYDAWMTEMQDTQKISFEVIIVFKISQFAWKTFFTDIQFNIEPFCSHMQDFWQDCKNVATTPTRRSKRKSANGGKERWSQDQEDDLTTDGLTEL